jgi:type II secretory pathway pseudopilin PulG
MYHKTKKREQKGFTLIELMLSVGFIGFLLITIALTIIQIMGLYNKGLTLKEVDSVSRVIVRDMQQGISGASMFTVRYEDETTPEKDYKVATTLQQADERGVDYYNNDAGGRLCTGVYSYVWNKGQALGSGDGIFGVSVPTSYKDPDNHDGSIEEYPIQFTQEQAADGSLVDKPVRFIKKADPAKALCKVPAGDAPETTVFDSKIGQTKDYQNVFGTGDNNLMLYKFAITMPLGTTANDDGNEVSAISTFYNISLVVGTQMGDEDQEGFVNTNNASCKSPNAAEFNDSEYCAVNSLDFVARTGSVAR